MLKVGTKVRLIYDNPDGHDDLVSGDTGIVLCWEDNEHVLVRWYKYTVDSATNDWLCEDYANDTFSEEDLRGRLWWVRSSEIREATSYPPFRKQKRGERILEYRVAKKIYELDVKFKEKQNAKANSVPVQDGQRECEEVSLCAL